MCVSSVCVTDAELHCSAEGLDDQHAWLNLEYAGEICEITSCDKILFHIFLLRSQGLARHALIRPHTPAA